MLELTHLRGNDCPDGRTCPAVKGMGGSLVIVGSKITDPAVLAQLAVGDGEVAITVPASLIPEVAASAD